jgi:hypothetical protein
MNGKRLLRNWLLPVVGLLMIAAGTIQAQMMPPLASFRLEAKVDDANVVHLSWDKPLADSVQKYFIYRMPNLSDASVQLIDSTTGLTSTDKPPVGPAITGFGGPRDGGSMKYMYTYYVIAKTTSTFRPLLYSTFAQVYLAALVNRDTVTFTSAPVTTAQTGVAYSSPVLATSTNPAAKITYVLDHKPDGMSLDLSGATPMLKWTPKYKGFYDVRVIARSDSGGQARQEFTINVAGGNGIVHGTVKDTLGAPITKVIIQILKRDSSPMSCFTYSTVTDANGEYRFTKLDPGTYILQAIPTSGDFQGQWFDGKSNPDEATKVSVSDSLVTPSGSTANFVLRGRLVLSTFITVKGSVTDTLGAPVKVKGTRAIFVRSDFALNSSTPSADVTMDNFKEFFDYDHATDFRFEGGSKYAFRASVDSLGNYSAKLPKGSYIVLARAPGYAEEFYNEQTDLLSANVLVLNADTTGINFTLAPLPPVVLGEISGAVLDTVKNVGVRARLVAFRDGWTTADGYKIAKNYFTDTDSLGNYQFTDLLPGSYFIMAIPMGGYAPAYYSTGDSVLAWRRATAVAINGNSVSGIDIFVKQLSATKSGFTWIGGGVKHRNNAGVAGAIVTAFDGDGMPAGYGFTDNNGSYKILGLAPGNYSVAVEKPGYTTTTTASVSPTYNMTATGGNTVGATASFTIDAVTSVEAQPSAVVPVDFTVSQNYPNPFNPSTKFQFSIPAAQRVTVKIFDMLGREVATLVNGQMNAGTYTVEWNASAMSSGIYFYRVQAGASSSVRKMMLLK